MLSIKPQLKGQSPSCLGCQWISKGANAGCAVAGAAAVIQSSVSLATSNNIECVPSAVASEMAMSWPGLYPEEEQDLSATGRFEYPEDTR